MASATTCGAACVDLQTAPEHCGACSQRCADAETCDAGFCVAGCADGLLECNGQCIDPNTDRTHCGGCNTGAGQNCASLGSDYVCNGAGTCAVLCEPDLDNCSGTCMDLSSDRANCGTTWGTSWT